MAKRKKTSKARTEPRSEPRPALKPESKSGRGTPAKPAADASALGSASNKRVLRGALNRITEEGFDGYVYDEADLGRRFVVELLLDGVPLKLARANAHTHQLAQQRVGDARYGFSFMVPAAVLAAGSVIEVRLANDGAAVAAPVALGAPSGAAQWRQAGDASWLGGLRFAGWCNPDQGASPNVAVWVDGEQVAVTQAMLWTHAGSGDNVRAVRGFDVQLPERFADGRVRRARFRTDSGVELTPEPLAFVAFPDALESMLSSMGEIETEKLRGALFDRLFPASLPLSDYQRWCERFPIDVETETASPIAVVLVGHGSVDTSLQSIESQGYAEWLAAAMPEQKEPTGFDRTLLSDFLDDDASHCEIIVFSLSGTVFSGPALQRIANAFADFPDADLIYPDVEIERADGSIWPIAWPAFDYERMLEQGYAAHLFAVRRRALGAMLKSDAQNLYRLFNSALDRGGAAAGKIVHVPGALGTLPPLPLELAVADLAMATAEHLKARDGSAKIDKRSGTAFPAIRVTRTLPRGSTTIIVPVRNKAARLRACLKSIQRTVTAARAEVIIVDDDSSDPEMLDILDELEGGSALVLRAGGDFNVARLNNMAAGKAQSEYLCLLGSSIEALDDRWLTEMLSRIAEPDVGAVGAMLLAPDRIVQHGGFVLGPGFAAAAAFGDRIESDPGYADALRVAHETSAVSAACLLTRRTDYLDCGGMDELRFAANFSDVDYCLKLRAAGKRVVFTPHARLVHHEPASPEGVLRNRPGHFERDLRMLRARWGDALMSDPCYNPMLSLDPIPFSGLAWPPRSMKPRTNDAPVPLDVVPGL